MRSLTLVFPTYESLWLFKNKMKGINIHISPGTQRISALFPEEDIELALQSFEARQLNEASRL